MTPDTPETEELSSQKLLEVIALQTEIARMGVDLSGILSLVVEKVLPLVGADGAAIELAEGEDMVYRGASGIASGSLGLRLRREGSLSGRCVIEGAPLVCQDSDEDPRVDREACRKVGLRSMLVVPLRHDSRNAGVLKIMFRRPGAIEPVHSRTLALLSDSLGAAMFHAAKFDADELFFRATHDSLTGLPNRSMFMDRMRLLLSQSRRGGTPLAVLMVDLDGLKSVNDVYGHRAGDALLVEFSRRVCQTLRQSDLFSRLGGDEFGGVLHPVASKAGVEEFIVRCREALSSGFVFENRTLPLSASFGAAVFPEDSDEMSTLIDAADRRMYEEKARHHRNVAPSHSL